MVTYQKDLYKTPIERQGGNYVKIDLEDQNIVTNYIEKVKKSGRGDHLEKDFSNLINGFKEKYNLGSIILGCTEFSVFKDIKFQIPLIDSSQCLADFIVDYAENKRQLTLDEKRVKGFWDQRAKELEESSLGTLQSTMLTQDEDLAEKKWEVERDKLLNVTNKFISPNDEVLELACGVGRWSRVWAKKVKTVYAFDYVEKFIEKAKKITPEKNIVYTCSPVENIPLERKYDHVVSIALLHYLDDKQFFKTIDLIKNSLKKGGKAIFRESFGLKKRFELHGFYSEVLKSDYHAIYRTSEELASYFGDDFKVIENQTSLVHDKSRSETVQKIVVLEKMR